MTDERAWLPKGSFICGGKNPRQQRLEQREKDLLGRLKDPTQHAFWKSQEDEEVCRSCQRPKSEHLK